jgi:hypothetical protein
MKRIIVVLSCFLLCVIFSQGSASGGQRLFSGDDPAKLSFFLGEVKSRLDENSEWQPAVLNQGLSQQSSLKTTEESRAEVSFRDGSVARMDQNSQLCFAELASDAKNQKVEGRLSVGRMWANVKKMGGKNSSFKTQTTTAVAAVRGTVFRLNLLPDSTTELYVYEGEVSVNPFWAKPKPSWPPKEVEGPKEVTMEEWTEIVRAQMRLIVKPDKARTRLVESFNPEEDLKDEWVMWNKKRDALR